MSGRRANPERGEHTLTLGGKSYLMRPTFAAQVAIEAAAGRSFMALLRLGNTGELSLTQLGTIAGEWIRAGATDELTRAVDDERIAELIYEEGVPGVMAKVTLCLLDVVTAGRDAAGNAKAVATAKKAGTTAA